VFIPICSFTFCLETRRQRFKRWRRINSSIRGR